MTEQNYIFPATLDADEDGRYLVRFRDLPEASTGGATIEEALAEAADWLNTALVGRLIDDEPIPAPSPASRKEYQVAPRPETVLKIAVCQAMAERDRTTADLARDMKIDHKEARRILDPREATKLPRLTEALGVLGYAVGITVYDRARRERLLSPPRPRGTGSKAVAAKATVVRPIARKTG